MCGVRKEGVVVDFALVSCLQELQIGWRSEDGEVMLGLPVHLYLWAGVIDTMRRRSREDGDIGHKKPMASKQEKGSLKER